MSMRPSYSNGSITVMVLALLVFSVVAITAAMQFLGRQSHEATNQAASEEALRLADSGVNYTLWLLNPTGGGVLPGDIATQLTDFAFNYPVTDPTTEKMFGTFNVTVLNGPDPTTQELKIKSIGRSTKTPTRCQFAEAALRPFGDQGFRIIASQYSGGTCPTSLPPLPVLLPQISLLPLPSGPIITESPPAPLSGDNFAGAVNIASLPFISTISDTLAATMETDEPHGSCGGADTGKSMWYKYVPPAATGLVFNTVDTDFNHVLAVYAGSSLGGLTQVGCAVSSSKTANVTVNVSNNTAYYVQVTGINHADINEVESGSITLHVTEPTAPTYVMACPWAYWPLDQTLAQGSNQYSPEALRAPNNPNLFLAMFYYNAVSLVAEHFPSPQFIDTQALLMGAAGVTAAQPQSTDKDIFTNNKVTLSVWIKHNSVPTASGASQRYVTLTNEVAVLRATDLGWEFYINTGSVLKLIRATGSLYKPSPGVWYHLVGVWDGGTLKLYVNGQLNNSKTETATVIHSSIDSVVLSSGGSEALNGYIDDVRVYNTALSAADITALAGGVPVAAACYAAAP